VVAEATGAAEAEPFRAEELALELDDDEDCAVEELTKLGNLMPPEEWLFELLPFCW